MTNSSPFLAIKDVEGQLKRILRLVDVDTLEPAARKVIADTRLTIVDTRLDIRDYELSETREEQLKKAVEGKKRVEELRKLILKASEYNIVGSVDVAHLSAQLEQIHERLL